MVGSIGTEHGALDFGFVTLSPTWLKRLYKNKIFFKNAFKNRQNKVKQEMTRMVRMLGN